MTAVRQNRVEIGVGRTEQGWVWAPLRAGITSIRFRGNERKTTSFFLGDDGFARSAVTGMAPEILISGYRVAGDRAQDYIAARGFCVGAARKTGVRVISGDRAVVCLATMCDVTAMGGAAGAMNAFSCVLRLDGKPEVNRL